MPQYLNMKNALKITGFPTLRSLQGENAALIRMPRITSNTDDSAIARQLALS